MKFICNGLTLAEAVIKVSKACAVRTTAPIMECIKITASGDSVSLLATDGELSMQKTVPADVSEEGAVCVPGKLFSDFISKLSGEDVHIFTGERGLELRYRDSGTFMQSFSGEEFPVINLEVTENAFTMKQSELKKVIAKTSFCCAQDDSRPILKGCLMEFSDKLTVTALDGFRLAVSEAELLSKSEEKKLVCPARTLTEIARILQGEEEEVVLYEDGGLIMVESEGTKIVSRLYQGDFIDRNGVIPTKFTTQITVNRNELVSSAERAAILIRGDKNNLVTMEITPDKLKLSSVSDYGNVAETIACGVDGVDITISMNAKFLLDALHALDEDEVVISFCSAVSPFILQNKEKKEEVYLILPVRNAA